MDLKEKLIRTIAPYRRYLPYVAFLYAIFLVILFLLFLIFGYPIVEASPTNYTITFSGISLIIAVIVPLFLVYLLMERLPKLKEEYQPYAKFFAYGLIAYIGYLLVIFSLFISSDVNLIPSDVSSNGIFLHPAVYLVAAAILPLILPYYLLWKKLIIQDQAPLAIQPIYTPSWSIQSDSRRFIFNAFSIVSLIFGLGLVFYSHISELGFRTENPWSWSWDQSFMSLITFLPGIGCVFLSLGMGCLTLFASIERLRSKLPFRRLSNRVYFLGAGIGFLLLVLGLIIIPVATQMRMNDIDSSSEHIVDDPQIQSEMFFLGIQDRQRLGRLSFRYKTTYMIMFSSLTTKNFSIVFKFVNTSSEETIEAPIKSGYYSNGDTLSRRDIEDSMEISVNGTSYYIITDQRIFFYDDPVSSVSCDISCNVTTYGDPDNDSLRITFIEDVDNIIKRNSIEISTLDNYYFFCIFIDFSSLLIIANSLILLLKKPQKLPSPKFCMNCGNAVSPEHKFCGSCRAKLDPIITEENVS